jgi:hypothetical protein
MLTQKNFSGKSSLMLMLVSIFCLFAACKSESGGAETASTAAHTPPEWCKNKRGYTVCEKYAGHDFCIKKYCVEGQSLPGEASSQSGVQSSPEGDFKIMKKDGGFTKEYINGKRQGEIQFHFNGSISILRKSDATLAREQAERREQEKRASEAIQRMRRAVETSKGPMCMVKVAIPRLGIPQYGEVPCEACPGPADENWGCTPIGSYP